MKKYKNLLIILGIIAFLAIIASLGRLTNKPATVAPGTGNVAGASTEPTLFYGDTCPHCKIVNDFVVANNVKAKLPFQELEVYNNQTNAAELIATAQKCNLDTAGGVGVPFFYDGQNCILGDQPIIDYFQTKLK
ncbi:MAG: hypothetical protein WC467_03385 [Patescibacteria group bacterium]